MAASVASAKPLSEATATGRPEGYLPEPTPATLGAETGEGETGASVPPWIPTPADGRDSMSSSNGADNPPPGAKISSSSNTAPPTPGLTAPIATEPAAAGREEPEATIPAVEESLLGPPGAGGPSDGALTRAP